MLRDSMLINPFQIRMLLHNFKKKRQILASCVGAKAIYWELRGSLGLSANTDITGLTSMCTDTTLMCVKAV